MLRCDWRSIAITLASSFNLKFDSHSKTMSYVDLLTLVRNCFCDFEWHSRAIIHFTWSKSGNGSSGFEISSRECTSCEIESRMEMEALRISRYSFQSASDKSEQSNDKILSSDLLQWLLFEFSIHSLKNEVKVGSKALNKLFESQRLHQLAFRIKLK
jgi:hypothetical protein